MIPGLQVGDSAQAPGEAMCLRCPRDAGQGRTETLVSRNWSCWGQRGTRPLHARQLPARPMLGCRQKSSQPHPHLPIWHDGTSRVPPSRTPRGLFSSSCCCERMTGQRVRADWCSSQPTPHPQATLARSTRPNRQEESTALWLRHSPATFPQAPPFPSTTTRPFPDTGKHSAYLPLGLLAAGAG